MDKKLQSGFSLVEILVGLVIGMLAMLAIFQTLALFEAQRRTTGAGADMQQSGLAALYALEQDIRLGGFGLIKSGLVVNGTRQQGSLPCPQIDAFGSTQSVFQSIPVQIQDGGTGLSDKLVTARLDSPLGGLATGSGYGYLVADAAGTTTYASNASSITVDTGKALKAGDYIMISQSGADCTLLQVKPAYNYCTAGCGTATPTNLADPTPVPVQSTTNPAGDHTTTPTSQSYTVPSGAVANPPDPPEIIDMGQTNPLVISSYYVDTTSTSSTFGSLIQNENYGTSVKPQAANIVNIQAQYGIAPAGSQSISCWVDATAAASTGTCAATSGSWAAPNIADYQRIKAIKIAVVARSPLKEKPQATATGSTCNTTTAAPATWPSVTGSSSPPTIDLSADANWKCYRYKVYWTVVPLRNVIWGNL